MNVFQLRSVQEPRCLSLGHGLTTLGQTIGNTFVLNNASISGHHCEIEIADQEVKVRDLQSTNGTFINDLPITEAILCPGQILQLGSLQFQLECTEVTIAVPSLSQPVREEKGPLLLANGALACSIFPNLPATVACDHCKKPYHLSALRIIRLASAKRKKPLFFCPACNGQCHALFEIDDPRGSFLSELPKKIVSGIRHLFR